MTAQSGLVRTFLVFMDLPVHYEYRAGEWPLLSENTVIEFDTVLRSPENPKLERRIGGSYRVKPILRYSTVRPGRNGLTQYLELRPVPPEGAEVGSCVAKTGEQKTL